MSKESTRLLTDLNKIKTDWKASEASARSNCKTWLYICPCGIKTSSWVFCFVFLCILQLQNGYVKSAQWRDVMTFSWMLYTKSKRPTICWVPAWRHLIPIPLMLNYHWNASRHHNPSKLVLALSEFSFHKERKISKLWHPSFLWMRTIFAVSEAQITGDTIKIGWNFTEAI